MEIVMKTALLCWELGAGLGHLTPIKQMSQELIARGYKVWIAARELHNIHHLFNDIDVNVIQAPVNRNGIKKATGNTLCFADLVHHIGYKDKESLANHIHGWQSIFELIKPEVIFFDHSPTAIIASQNQKTKKILMGTPFSRPPESFVNKKGVFAPLGDLSSQQITKAKVIEKETLENINYACNKNNLPILKRISDLFSPIGIELFSCLEEFDHFPYREESSRRFYLPTTTNNSGDIPEWPNAIIGSKKIFAYLAARKNIIPVLNGLIASKHSTIIYIRGEFEIAQKLPNHIKILKQPASMSDVLQQCDLIISNGNLNTAQQTALAGLPQLAYPNQLEQDFLTLRLQQQGVAERFDDRSPQQSKLQINRLLNKKPLKLLGLQAKYSAFDEKKEIKRIFNLILNA
jgi:hypothetical protein